MLWTIARAALILVAGPLIALYLLFFGCSGVSPALGIMCGHNSLVSLVVFTLGAWLVLGTVAVLLRSLMHNE